MFTFIIKTKYMILLKCFKQAIWLINLFIKLRYSEMINFKYKQMNIHVKDNLDVIMKLKDDNNDAIALIKNR